MIRMSDASEHIAEATYLGDYQRWVVGRLMKRLLNQISPKSSEVGQLKDLLSLITKMLSSKSTYEKAINARN